MLRSPGGRPLHAGPGGCRAAARSGFPAGRRRAAPRIPGGARSRCARSAGRRAAGRRPSRGPASSPLAPHAVRSPLANNGSIISRTVTKQDLLGQRIIKLFSLSPSSPSPSPPGQSSAPFPEGTCTGPFQGPASDNSQEPGLCGGRPEEQQSSLSTFIKGNKSISLASHTLTRSW